MTQSKSLSHGRKFLAIPGPTTVPDEVLQAMHRPAIEIYSGEIVDTTQAIYNGARRVFRTGADSRIYLYASNGHGAWEAALSNTLSRGDKVLVLESGKFATGWGDMGALMGVVPEVLPGRPRGGVDVAAVEARLRADSAHEIKAILAVQIDTASGVWNDIEAIGKAVRAAGHPALYMVDAVASLGCVPFEMDEWGVDLTVTGSQKGLMTPPGLSLVAAGPRARAAHGPNDLRTQYWDWEYREGPVFYQQFCGTPPEQLLFAMERALQMLLEEEGLESAWRRHAILAEATRRAVAVWEDGGAGALNFNILDPLERSDTVTTLRCAEGFDAETLRRFTTEQCGLTLGSAIGELSDKGIRIAHMGHVNAVTQLGVLATTEMGLRALGWPHGEGGAQAAIAYLGDMAA
ncbi:MAG: aminotransferase class V-fold PLP-dependent enzyme [Rhodobacteraceae bacterium]|nr:aminotransferase class V-fold PLP-dependent enzyme [Paracoccaceae bacterium]